MFLNILANTRKFELYINPNFRKNVRAPYTRELKDPQILDGTA
jgi:hypothetical protein